MNFSGNHFEYNGISSRKYSLIFAHVDTSEYASAIGEVSTNYAFNNKTKQRLFIGENFEDSPIQFDAEIVRWGCGNDVISVQERREIEKWLFHRPGYNRLYVDIMDDNLAESVELVDGYQKRLYLNCRFINPIKIEDGIGLRGYKFTVECDSCMAWQDEVVKEFQIFGASTSVISLEVDTDIRDYTYPRVIIRTGSVGGDITITNHTDDSARHTEFVSLPANHEITIDGKTNFLSGQNFQHFKNRNFIRLLDGENNISINGDISKITFKWNNRRYL